MSGKNIIEVNQADAANIAKTTPIGGFIEAQGEEIMENMTRQADEAVGHVDIQMDYEDEEVAEGKDGETNKEQAESSVLSSVKKLSPWGTKDSGKGPSLSEKVERSIDDSAGKAKSALDRAVNTDESIMDSLKSLGTKASDGVKSFGSKTSESFKNFSPKSTEAISKSSEAFKDWSKKTYSSAQPHINRLFKPVKSCCVGA